MPHTPGPWFADDDGYIYGGPDRLILTDPSSANPDIPAEETEANAALIAAAPDLLAALKGTMRTLRMQHGDDCKCLECQNANAAIAKAEKG
jgi:hypothetical protein